mmetsp:Transcript_3988/g.8772  ORF Transcript_3988/g.8772 Transcript_3988/m.8772 type:complete len:221 (-) Transcript_3988:48-710(-)
MATSDAMLFLNTGSTRSFGLNPVTNATRSCTPLLFVTCSASPRLNSGWPNRSLSSSGTFSSSLCPLCGCRNGSIPITRTLSFTFAHRTELFPNQTPTSNTTTSFLSPASRRSSASRISRPSSPNPKMFPCDLSSSLYVRNVSASVLTRALRALKAIHALLDTACVEILARSCVVDGSASSSTSLESRVEPYPSLRLPTDGISATASSAPRQNAATTTLPL